MGNPENISVSLVRLKNHEQEDTELPIIDNEDDEPYVVVLSIDVGARELDGLLGSAAPPAFQLFRIGPMEDIDEGDLKAVPANELWNLDGIPAPMDEPTRSLFIVGLLENDNADPAQVVGQARTILHGSLLGAWNNAINRRDLGKDDRFGFYAESASAAFASAIDTARGVSPVGAALDPDDRIGAPQLLLLSEDEHRRVLNHAPSTIERTLHFEGDHASYDLTFMIHHPGASERPVTHPGAPLSAAFQASDRQLSIAFADVSGGVSVMWVIGGGKWEGPVGVAPANTARVGAPIALHHQGGLNQLDALFVDHKGVVNVMWVIGGGKWEGPVGLTPANTAPAGAPIALHHQGGSNQLDALFVDHKGVVNVMWVIGGGKWEGPVGLTPANTAPAGAPIALHHQGGSNQLDALFVDHQGVVNVMWVIGGGKWEGPVGLTPANTAPAGAPIALHRQGSNQLNALFVDHRGVVNVMWVIGGGHWEGPVGLTPPNTAPAGAPIALHHQGGSNQLDALFVDHKGVVNVMWVIEGGGWEGPLRLTPENTAPAGAPVALHHQGGSNQLDALFVDSKGGVNVMWVIGGGSWEGPLVIT